MAHNLVAPRERLPSAKDNTTGTGQEIDSALQSSEHIVHSTRLRLSGKRSRKRSPRIVNVESSSTSDVPQPKESWSQRKQNQKPASRTRPNDEGHERQRLNQSSVPLPSYGSTRNIHEIRQPTARTCRWSERFFSVMLFLFVLVLGMTLVVCSNVRSDKHVLEIKPRVVNVYTIFLIIVFIVWVICDKLNSWNANEIANLLESGSLIPSHLLNGLVLFGVGSSICQVVTIVDFTKCQRYVFDLDKSYLVYPFFEMTFMFCQIYVFYTLSKDRERKMLFGNPFTMFTLAVNLTIWAIYFFAGAVKSPQLKNKTWLTHYYFGDDNDTCLLATAGMNSGELHKLRLQMMPFMYTLAMEYTLLASALLLHLWLGITRENAGEYGAVKRKWTIWRCAFILGLLSLPLLGTMAVNVGGKYSHSKLFVVFCGECVLFVLLFVCALRGLHFVKTDSFVIDPGPVKVDVILLCLSWVGFLVFDLFSMFAASAEVFRTFNGHAFGLGIVALVELVSTGTLTMFLVTAYSRKLRPLLSVLQFTAPKRIRQIGSFGVIVSFGFWAMRTYSFRSTHSFDFVSEDFYGKFAWFVICQLSVPLCTFYHFHSAVCFTEVIAGSTPI